MMKRVPAPDKPSIIQGTACGVAQSYPLKPVRMVVPWPPGGTIKTDMQKLAGLVRAADVQPQ